MKYIEEQKGPIEPNQPSYRCDYHHRKVMEQFQRNEMIKDMQTMVYDEPKRSTTHQKD